MRHRMRSCIWLALCSLLATISPLPQPEPARQDTAIVNVHVVTMAGPDLLPGQTVIVADGHITAIGPTDSVAISPDTHVIDGAGGYLMPALTDMHVHVETEQDLLFYLAYGVTTVRNMNGRPHHLRWRGEVDQGARLGPRIVTAGPCLGELPHAWTNATPDDITAAVAAQKTAGYDFIKVYDHLPASLYGHVLRAAAAHGMTVAGHMPDGVPPMDVIASGQRTIEHLDGYCNLQPHQLPDAIAATSAAQVWNTPTLTIWQRFRPSVGEAGPAQTAMRQYAAWHAKSTLCTPADFHARAYALGPVSTQRREIVAALHAAGAPLLLGTDAPHLCTIPGYSVHQELQNFVDAGLTPYDALRTATVNPARYWGEFATRGTVAVGKEAELLLLRRNPLADVTATQEIVGVMHGGEWLTPSDLLAQAEKPPLREATLYAMLSDRQPLR